MKMTLMHTLEIVSPIFLSLICWLRFRAGRQPLGSLVVGCAMLAAVAAIAYDADGIAKCFQVGGLVIAGILIFRDERWKRSQRQER